MHNIYHIAEKSKREFQFQRKHKQAGKNRLLEKVILYNSAMGEGLKGVAARSVVVFRFRRAGAVQSNADGHDHQQREHHDRITAYNGSVALNAVFTEEAYPDKGENEKKDRQSMFPTEAVCADRSNQVIQENIEQKSGCRYLRKADKGGIGIQARQEGEVHKGGIRAERIGYDLNHGIGNEEHPPDIPCAPAGPEHLYSSAAAEKAKYDEKGKDHKKGFQHKNSRAVCLRARSVRNGNAEGETLQKRNRYRAFADAAAVKKSAEAYKNNKETDAGSREIQQAAGFRNKTEFACYESRQENAQNDAGETVAADIKARQRRDNPGEDPGAESGGILLHIEVPVEQAADQEGKNNRKREEEAESSGAGIFGFPQRKRHRQKSDDPEENHDG